MKIAEAKELKKGDLVKVSLGNGWWQTLEFVRLVKVQHLGRFTLDSLKTAKLDMNVKPVLEMLLVDDDGKTHTYSIRKVRKADF